MNAVSVVKFEDLQIEQFQIYILQHLPTQSMFILCSHWSYAGCLTRIVSANKYRSGHDYRCFAKLWDKPDRSGFNCKLLKTWYEIIIGASKDTPKYFITWIRSCMQLYSWLKVVESSHYRESQRPLLFISSSWPKYMT